MLTFRQLDDLPQAVLEVIGETERTIINDMVRRIAKTGSITDSTQHQFERLQAIGAEHDFIVAELAKMLHKAEKELILLFDEAATRTLASDDAIYRSAGLSPAPLAESPYMQQIIRAGLKKTLDTYRNLTKTTADTATRQFENALDLAYHQIISGGFSYQQAIRAGIRALTTNGIATITYPTTHTDFLDVCFRRATLTGVNQTCAELQLRRMAEMETDLVETTAHHGARIVPGNGPANHAWWQGRWFSLSHNTSKYPDFYKETGYGTGEGLCGWNCRHSFFPVIEGLSDRAYSLDQLREFNSRTVVHNGKEMSLYDATQRQREIERHIRHWKREASAMEAAGLDNSFANGKVREWQAAQRDFINQTGLRRDYFRERAGKQSLETPSKDAIIKQLTGKHFSTGNPGVPKVTSLPDGILPQTANVELGTVQSVVPKGTRTSNVRVLAGSGTSTALRDISRLDAQYGGDPAKWQKITGTVEGSSYRYEVHWYENDGSVPPGEIYTRRVWPL